MAADIMETLRAETRREMKERHWGKAELARRAGIKENRIKDVLSEKSKNPQIDTVAAIAGAFNRTVSDMIGEGVTARPAELDAALHERLPELVAEVAEQILIFVREKELSDDPHAVAQEISAAYAQRLEPELMIMRPIVVKLGGNVFELSRRRRTVP